MPASRSPEVDRLTSSLSIWHRYDNEVKAELFSTAVKTEAGIYLVDPIPLDPASVERLIGPQKVAGIIVTNVNHRRAADVYSVQYAVPIYASGDTGIPVEGVLPEGPLDRAGLTVVSIEGAAAGEIALFREDEEGTLIVGDALINFGSLGFAFLPAKYCSNQKRMRKSLAKLLAYSFTRILFAHGTPLVTQAKSRLAALLDGQE